MSDVVEQLCLFDLDMKFGRMSPERSPPQKAKISGRCLKKRYELRTASYQFLDLREGGGNLLGASWETNAPLLGEYWTLNTGPAPHNGGDVSTLSQILQAAVPLKYYLSKAACLGILRRAEARGKDLPQMLRRALQIQAGTDAPIEQINTEKEPFAFHINQREETIDLGGVSGALMATNNMQMQTFVTNCMTPWDARQKRIFLLEGSSPTLTGADGGGGRNPAGLLFTAGFCAGASPTAGSIGFQVDVSPTLKAAESGTNMVPSVLCLNDQGGQRMDVSEDITGTLRADEKGHQPLLFENHGIDSRYTGPHPVAPTMSARYGTGGNNQPLVAQEPEAYCIAGNIIDREVQNGGNGFGYQADLAYTLTAMDHHAVFSRRRSDQFSDESDVASTQSARQHKDATDLVCYGQAQFANYSEGVATLRAQGGDHGGGSENLITSASDANRNLIRRLTPLECERLQGYADGWTDIPGASDSARYKALGNSVAIPCVEYVMRGIAYFLSQGA